MRIEYHHTRERAREKKKIVLRVVHEVFLQNFLPKKVSKVTRMVVRKFLVVHQEWNRFVVGVEKQKQKKEFRRGKKC